MISTHLSTHLPSGLVKRLWLEESFSPHPSTQKQLLAQAPQGCIPHSTSNASRSIPWSHAVLGMSMGRCGEKCKCKGAFFPAELRCR